MIRFVVGIVDRILDAARADPSAPAERLMPHFRPGSSGTNTPESKRADENP
ncbi:MAG: hypothetical protein JOY90_34220 [Bradyrhizobium sp.]|uniref:hypothetical protein n=1 Tax=Bradyrhizobium sp. TaxID=376 RepID=UPI001D6D674E|nr:hypothetical protein [Bradyrhizobium sp.]MBV9565470.1 hypothetical protein [Bradyrhizobium sp.]